MTGLDSSFAEWLTEIVYFIFVFGMMGWALADLPNHRDRENKSSSGKNGDPASHEQEASADDADLTQSVTDSHRRQPVSDYERRLIILTALIASVTAIYAFVSAQQWQTMKEEAEATQQTAIAAKRSADAAIAETKALLAIGSFRVIPEAGFLDFTISNYGKIPSPHIEITEYIIKAGRTLIPGFDCHTDKVSADNIRPGINVAFFRQSLVGLIGRNDELKLTTLDSFGLVEEFQAFALDAKYENGFDTKPDTFQACTVSSYDHTTNTLTWPICPTSLFTMILHGPCKQIQP